MPETMHLLSKALEVKSIPMWHESLGLSSKALYTARDREHLSPAIAGAIAQELGENVDHWIVVAALESEKESACKKRMVKWLKGREKP